MNISLINIYWSYLLLINILWNKDCSKNVSVGLSQNMIKNYEGIKYSDLINQSTWIFLDVLIIRRRL